MPLPPGLQDHLASFLEKTGNDDLVGILSQNHLQFLHSQFLGIRRKKAEEKLQHPMWSKVNELICRDSNIDYLPQSPPGLAFTINEYMRQYSTAIGNMWQGNIYHKSLDHLTRILLRLHLAPAREAAFKQRVNDNAKEKAVRKSKKGKASVLGQRPQKMKLWTWKVKRLMDQLAEAMQKRRSQDEVAVILQRLAELKKGEPARHAEEHRQFLSLEEQLDQSEGSLAESEEIGNIWDGLVGQSLEDMDVDDAEELEDDNLSEEEYNVSNSMNIVFVIFFFFKKKLIEMY